MTTQYNDNIKRLSNTQSEYQLYDDMLELLHEKDSIHDWEPIKWKMTDQKKRIFLRKPNARSRKYPISEDLTYENVPFAIGNKHYPNLNNLKAKTELEDIWCHNDCGIPDVVAVYRCHYGYIVMYIKEHFLCYDRYDRLYDKRFDHYYYVFDGENLSLLHYADTSESLYVTDNIDKIHWLHLRKMKQYSTFPFKITP